MGDGKACVGLPETLHNPDETVSQNLVRIQSMCLGKPPGQEMFEAFEKIEVYLSQLSGYQHWTIEVNNYLGFSVGHMSFNKFSKTRLNVLKF